MSFAFPWVLLLLPLVLFLLRKRPMSAIVVSSLAGWRNAAEPRRIRWLHRLRFLRAATGALLIIAMAGPHSETAISEEIRQGIAIKMLVDISSSMDLNLTTADGERTTRMEAVKKTVAAFIENRPDDLIGLITFARYADTLSPLTFGHSALMELVEELEIQDRPNEDGTAYGDALMLACAHLDKMNDWQTDPTLPENDATAQIQTKTIILLTDGENNCGLHLPQEAAGLAAKWNIRIYSISLADAIESELTDAEVLLQNISEATGGGFWKIAGSDELDDTYATIGRLETSEIKNARLTFTKQQHVFTFFALPALLLLLLESILRSTMLRVAEEVTP